MKVLASNLALSTQRVLLKKMYAVQRWSFTAHLTERLSTRGYTWADVENVIDNGVLVEWHDENATDRIVVEVKQPKVRVSLVLDLTTETIITLYVRGNDNLGRNNKPYLGSD